MKEHHHSGSSTAQLSDTSVRDVRLSPMSGRRQAHPVLTPVTVRLLLFVAVALTFSGFVKQLVYAIYWLNSGARGS